MDHPKSGLSDFGRFRCASRINPTCGVKPAGDTWAHVESDEPENALVARVEARKTLPRQDAPAPLSRRHVPANVAVAEFPLQNDAEPVAEKVQIGRVAWKSRVDDVDGIGGDIVLQTRPRFLAGAAAQYQKCHKDCCCAAHRSAPPRGRGSMFALAPTVGQRKCAQRDDGGARRCASIGRFAGPAMSAPRANGKPARPLIWRAYFGCGGRI